MTPGYQVHPVSIMCYDMHRPPTPKPLACVDFLFGVTRFWFRRVVQPDIIPCDRPCPVGSSLRCSFKGVAPLFPWPTGVRDVTARRLGFFRIPSTDSAEIRAGATLPTLLC